ncbi:MAG TPA: class I SAM-dependent methyltransferase [Isosphaeraceae bacterium]|jgi:ubiquinone/menaquinone biosynthesis C-methylase UbiE|nr:class I SAM-dependent methyltransferase [Isosphaeraceae bacterium]
MRYHCIHCYHELEVLPAGGECPSCGRRYPRVAGLLDLRVAPDCYLSLDDERAKAERLAGHETDTDVLGLASVYYSMTDDVDEARRRRFLAHIAHAESRGSALAAAIPAGSRVLEVGCGTGGFLVAARRAGLEVVGADVATRWLVVARRRLADRGLSAPIVGANAERLPWADASFDVVVADSVLEHLADPLAALREWRRVVRPGGRLLVWSPNRYTLLPDPHVGLWGLGWLPRRWAPAYVRLRRGLPWSVRPLSTREALDLAAKAGWRAVEAGPIEVPASWARGAATRAAIRSYRVACATRAGRAIVGHVGPLWQVSACREEAA